MRTTCTLAVVIAVVLVIGSTLPGRAGAQSTSRSGGGQLTTSSDPGMAPQTANSPPAFDSSRVRGPAYPRRIGSATSGRVFVSLAPLVVPVQSTRSAAGCVLAELSFGFAGLVFGNRATAAVTDGPGLPLVVGGLGTVAGLQLGARVDGCRISAWGSSVGAGLAVLLGVTAGNAFAERRSEADDGVVWTANLIMLPIAWLGGVVVGAVSH